MSQVDDLRFDVLGLFLIKERKEEARNALIWATDVEKECKRIYLVLWTRAGVVEGKRLLLHLGSPLPRSIPADVLGSPVAVANMPPVFFILYMLAASSIPSCPI